MINEEEKKTLGLFGYVFLAYLIIRIIFNFSELIKLEIVEYLFNVAHPSLMILGLFLLIIMFIYWIAFFALGYQSAKILKKHGKTKIAPIFWLLLLFVPVVNLISAVILWIKNNNLLREGTPS